MRTLAMLVLTLSFGCYDPDAAKDPTDTEPFVFEVPKGASAGALGDELRAVGLIEAEWTWKLFLRQEDARCLKAGRFQLRRSMSMRQVLETLCGPPMPEDVPFTVVEGWRIRDTDAALAAQGWIEPGAYRTLAERKGVDLPFAVTAPTLEGYLYPETYLVVPARFDPADLIARQLKTFQDRFLSSNPNLGERTLHEVVVMASMLEREEPKPTQRPLVAGILWKRIDNGWALGVDATSRYTLADWNDRKAFLKQLRDPGDPYNTRLRKGLPPTPIGSPAIASLQAALTPVASEFWYYLHDSAQNLHPARNASEHEANRAKYDVY